MNDQLKAAQLELAKRELASRSGPGFIKEAAQTVPGQFALGGIESFGQTGYGLAATGLEGLGWAAGKLGMPGVEIGLKSAGGGLRDIANRGAAALPQPEGLMQTVARKGGEFTADIATLAAPGGSIVKGEKLIGGLVSKVPGLTEKAQQIYESSKWGKAAIGTTKVIPTMATQSGLGYVYGRSKGETPEQAQRTAEAFGVLGGFTGAASQAMKSRIENVSQNALSSVGAKAPEGANIKNFSDSLVRGYKEISDRTKGVIVKDINGVEKEFSGSKSNYWEASQAVKYTKKSIYEEYTKLAGDSGEKFGQKQFNSVINQLKESAFPGGDLSRLRSHVDKVIQDIRYDYGVFKNGKFTGFYKDIPLSEAQKLVEKINVGFNKTSEAGASVVNGLTSQYLRKEMDSVIMGGKYQNLRDRLYDVKNVEDGMETQLRKTYSASRSEFSYLEIIGAVEAGTAISKGEAGKSLPAVLLAAITKLQRHLASPETKMREVFKFFEPEKSPSKLKTAGLSATKAILAPVVGGLSTPQTSQ